MFFPTSTGLLPVHRAGSVFDLSVAELPLVFEASHIVIQLSGPKIHMECWTAKVSPNYHVRFDNAYYSVDQAYLHEEVLIELLLPR